MAIYEALPLVEAKDFLSQFLEAVREDGRDLSRVQWQFLGETLRDLPAVDIKVQAVVGRVAAGMDILAVGQEWPDAVDAYLAAVDADARCASAAAATYVDRRPLDADAAARRGAAAAATAASAALRPSAAAFAAAKARQQYWLKQKARLLRLIAAA